MKRNTLNALLIIFSLLKGTFAQITTTPTSLEGMPTYIVTGPGGDKTATLFCAFDAQYDEENPPHRTWMEGGAVLLFDDSILRSRFDSSLINEETARYLTLKIDPVKVTDEGLYGCQLTINQFTLKSHANLSINQFPTIRAKSLLSVVEEGKEETVASCHADMAKPTPKMWFEDSIGNKISNEETSINVKECGNGLTNTTIFLTKSFNRVDMDETYYCKIKHENRTTPYSIELEKVNVLHPPSVTLKNGNGVIKSQVVLEEGTYLSVFCDAIGFPKPNVTWTFVPDITPYSEDEHKEETPLVPFSGIPNNFILTDDNHRILTQKVQVPDEDGQTNNGTFTCTATNGVGSDASLSFQLQVYAMPTTTAPPTTAVLPTEKDGLNHLPSIAVPVTPELRQGGPSAAVIAGIVAVAVFVLIVTVILLLRYFMSHKGEYYTNELKRGEDLPNDTSENDDELLTEAELLGEKKRTEHFL